MLVLNGMVFFVFKDKCSIWYFNFLVFVMQQKSISNDSGHSEKYKETVFYYIKQYLSLSTISYGATPTRRLGCRSVT